MVETQNRRRKTFKKCFFFSLCVGIPFNVEQNWIYFRSMILLRGWSFISLDSGSYLELSPSYARVGFWFFLCWIYSHCCIECVWSMTISLWTQIELWKIDSERSALLRTGKEHPFIKGLTNKMSMIQILLNSIKWINTMGSDLKGIFAIIGLPAILES